MFFCRRIRIFSPGFCAKSQITKKSRFLVDKTRVLWLNASIYENNFDGKLALTGSSRESAFGASRYGGFWRSDS